MERIKELSHEEFLRHAIKKLEKILKDVDDPAREAADAPLWNLRSEEDMGLPRLLDGLGAPPEETRAQLVKRKLEEYRGALKKHLEDTRREP